MAVSYENLPGAGSAPRSVDHPNVLDLRVPGPLEETLPPTPIRELLIRIQLLLTRYSDLDRQAVPGGRAATGAVEGAIAGFGAVCQTTA